LARLGRGFRSGGTAQQWGQRRACEQMRARSHRVTALRRARADSTVRQSDGRAHTGGPSGGSARMLTICGESERAQWCLLSGSTQQASGAVECIFVSFSDPGDYCCLADAPRLSRNPGPDPHCRVSPSRVGVRTLMAPPFGRAAHTARTACAYGQAAAQGLRFSFRLRQNVAPRGSPPSGRARGCAHSKGRGRPRWRRRRRRHPRSSQAERAFRWSDTVGVSVSRCRKNGGQASTRYRYDSRQLRLRTPSWTFGLGSPHCSGLHGSGSSRWAKLATRAGDKSRPRPISVDDVVVVDDPPVSQRRPPSVRTKVSLPYWR
jgi:hypothetical protein